MMAFNLIFLYPGQRQIYLFFLFIDLFIYGYGQLSLFTHVDSGQLSFVTVWLRGRFSNYEEDKYVA